MPLKIRTMREADLDFAARCTAGVDWPSETREVFEGFFLHDPSGCFLAERDGRAAGICVATAYGRTGFIGELVVVKEARGLGLGPRLLEEAIAHLRHRGVKSILLDAVGRAVPYYESVGFRSVCRSLRFKGTIAGRPDPRIRPMKHGDLPEIFRLDAAGFGEDRSFFLERRLALEPGFAHVLVRDGRIAGFILGMKGQGLVAAGPMVVTPDVEDPLALLAALAMEAGGSPLRVGVLESNERAVASFRSLAGLAGQPGSRRMVLGPSDPAGHSPLCWAVGSPAKG
jgi:GNAT superfamily N-acetyltransferase